MPSRLGALGALSLRAALAGGVVLGLGDAAGNPDLDVAGAVLLAVGVPGYLGAGISAARREGLGLAIALRRSAKEALRLAWFVFKGA